jgi:hypothetical protein
MSEQLLIANKHSLRCAAQRNGHRPEIQVLAQSNTRQIQVLAKLGQHQSILLDHELGASELCARRSLGLAASRE